MALWFSFALFLTLGIGVFCLGTAIWAPQSAFSNRLRVLLREPVTQVDDESPSRIENALESLSKTLPKSPSEVSKTRAFLMQAGYREDRHLPIFFGIRALCVLVALAFVFTTGLAIKSPGGTLASPTIRFSQGPATERTTPRAAGRSGAVGI